MSYELTGTSDYLREQNVLFIGVDLSSYLLEYYVQRKNLLAKVSQEQDRKLKDLIACFAVHLTARTTFETHAWTVNLVSEKPYSLFVTGSTGELDDSGIARGFLVGNVLTEHIRHSDSNGIHAQVTRRGRTFNSYVPCESSEISDMVERFYLQSEQMPIRIKISQTNDTASGLVALPGYEPEWFKSVSLDEIAENISKYDVNRMRDCRFTFSCDCSPEKLLPFFNALEEASIEELYGRDRELVISCPRCGKEFTIGRELIKPQQS